MREGENRKEHVINKAEAKDRGFMEELRFK